MGRTLKNNQTILILLTLLINIIWALSYPISKLILISIDPWELTWYRLFYASLAMAPFLYLEIRRFNHQEKMELIQAFFQFLSMALLGLVVAIGFQFWGSNLTWSSHISLFVGLEPPIVALAAWLVLKERPSKTAFIGLGLALFGVMLATMESGISDRVNQDILIGDFLLLISILGYASYTLFGKKLGIKFSPTILTALPFIFATFIWGTGMVLAGRSLSWGFHLPWDLKWQIFYCSVVASAFCYLAWNYLVQRVPVVLISYSLNTQVFFGALFSWLLLGEKLSWHYWMGLGLVLFALRFLK